MLVVFQMLLNGPWVWGAIHLGTLIMRRLHEKVKCHYRWEGPKWLVPDLTFGKYVELTRLCYEDERRIGKLEMLVNADKYDFLAGEFQARKISSRISPKRIKVE